MRHWIQLVALLLFLMGTGVKPADAQGNSPIIPGQIVIEPTVDHIGVLWWVEGDQDLDSGLMLEYRKLGTQSWYSGAPAMRAYPSLWVQDGPLNLNYWAASALFLEPATAYELRLTLIDPDGGDETRLITASTRSFPQSTSSGQPLFVIPGSGGGSGSISDPFKGLQAASDAAQPGDILHVAPGTYEPFQLLSSGVAGNPIVIQGPADGSAVVDGSGTDRGVLTLGEYDQTTQHIIITGLTIQNGRWGIDAQNTRDIFIHHNRIADVSDGIVNRRANAVEANQAICDNVILGRTPWPGMGIPSERGIDLRGTGNIVCHNTVRYFGDCISVQPTTGASYGNDIFGNDVSYCVDDGIEIDYNQANARVWRNRVMNARMGVSVQPIRGGPAYILRNEFFNLESVPIKMHNSTTGFYVAHNSGAKHVNGHGDNGAMWRNAIFRNNLFLGTRYAFEFTTIPDEGFRDFDYNAWGTTREIDPGGPHFKWDNVRFDTLADLPPGVEDHGMEADFSHLVDASLPLWWDVAAEPGSRDLRLQPGAPERDAGVALANLNVPFVSDGQPDLGAFEFGEPLPLYGPRTAQPDLDGSTKMANSTAPGLGDTVIYTLRVQNTGSPLTQPILVLDTVPTGLLYVPGSLSASMGAVDDSESPLLKWQGELMLSTPVMIMYEATVQVNEPKVISNTMIVDAGDAGLISRSFSIVVNGSQSFLPLLRFSNDS